MDNDNFNNTVNGTVGEATALPWRFQTCGKCDKFRLIEQAAGAIIGGPKLGECWFGPPTPIIVGVTPQGAPSIAMVRARLPQNHPACYNFTLDSSG